MYSRAALARPSMVKRLHWKTLSLRILLPVLSLLCWPALTRSPGLDQSVSSAAIVENIQMAIDKYCATSVAEGIIETCNPLTSNQYSAFTGVYNTVGRRTSCVNSFDRSFVGYHPGGTNPGAEAEVVCGPNQHIVGMQIALAPSSDRGMTRFRLVCPYKYFHLYSGWLSTSWRTPARNPLSNSTKYSFSKILFSSANWSTVPQCAYHFEIFGKCSVSAKIFSDHPKARGSINCIITMVGYHVKSA